MKKIIYGCAGEGRILFMEKKTVSGIMLALLLIGMLALTWVEFGKRGHSVAFRLRRVKIRARTAQRLT